MPVGSVCVCVKLTYCFLLVFATSCSFKVGQVWQLGLLVEPEMQCTLAPLAAAAAAAPK